MAHSVILLPAIKEQYDMFDESATHLMDFQFLQGRSKIIEITAVNDLMFALAESGLGVVYSNTTNKCIGCLNMSADESIRRLFYNKINNSFITVYRSDDSPMWKFRSTPIECIRRNELNGGIPVFVTNLPPSKGFDIFSPGESKFLHYRDKDGLWVYDLMDYSLLYSVPCRNLDNIEIRSGIMTLISKRTRGCVRLRILSVDDGKEHRSFNLPLRRYKSLEFIEQFHEKILFKQKDEELQILDMRNLELVNVDANNFWSPCSCTFLHHIQYFLARKDNKVEVMNLQGERIIKFEDHELFDPGFGDYKIQVSGDHDLIISFCKARGGKDEGEVDAGGSINMSNVSTGKCMGKICANDPRLRVNPRLGGNTDGSSNQHIIRQALKHVTFLFFDEDENVLYSANEEGFIHVWSN